jgi:hypothetical protein
MAMLSNSSADESSSQQSGRNRPDRSRQRRAAIAGKLVDFRANQEFRILAQMQDQDSGCPGIVGKVTSFESELSQRQAVARHCPYFFLADKTPLVLLRKGKVSLKELKILESLK